jgi:hypothetical protein
MNKIWNEFVICLIDQMDDRKVKGVFYLECGLTIGDVSQKLGVSDDFKHKLGLRWSLMVTKVTQGSGLADTQSKSHSIVGVMRKILDRLKESSAVIILPENNPR